MYADAPPAAAATSPSTTAGQSITDTLYTATETAVSGAAVAFLILWTIAVTGWTAFQASGSFRHDDSSSDGPAAFRH